MNNESTARRFVLVIPLVAAALLSSPAASADPLAAADLRAGGPQVAAVTPDLRQSYAGSFRYAGDQKERRAREDAIDRTVSSFFFAVRGIARSKLEDRTRILATCTFEFPAGKIRSIVPGHPIAASPETGAPTDYRIDADAFVLSQRFEGKRLVQTFVADDGGTRKNEFTLSADGKLLFMTATLTSPKLKAPVVYTLTYARTA